MIQNVGNIKDGDSAASVREGRIELVSIGDDRMAWISTYGPSPPGGP
jgi:hypothetical protein